MLTFSLLPPSSSSFLGRLVADGSPATSLPLIPPETLLLSPPRSPPFLSFPLFFLDSSTCFRSGSLRNLLAVFPVARRVELVLWEFVLVFYDLARFLEFFWWILICRCKFLDFLCSFGFWCWFWVWWVGNVVCIVKWHKSCIFFEFGFFN